MTLTNLCGSSPPSFKGNMLSWTNQCFSGMVYPTIAHAYGTSVLSVLLSCALQNRTHMNREAMPLSTSTLWRRQLEGVSPQPIIQLSTNVTLKHENIISLQQRCSIQISYYRIQFFVGPIWSNTSWKACWWQCGGTITVAKWVWSSAQRMVGGRCVSRTPPV
jgi:hypothetical protein